jgi:hypothetical protein
MAANVPTNLLLVADGSVEELSQPYEPTVSAPAINVT